MSMKRFSNDSRTHQAVGQASRLSLNFNGLIVLAARCLSRLLQIVTGSFEYGDRRDACPTSNVRCALPLPRSVVLTLALLVFAFIAFAQKSPRVRGSDFSVPENYGPPHETQLKSLLQGAEAEPFEGDLTLILIRQLLLQTFAEDGTTQLVVRAPVCVFDRRRREVRSAGRFEARSGDGNFLQEGEGFLFQMTNLNLTISNRVRTTIRSSSTNSFFR